MIDSNMQSAVLGRTGLYVKRLGYGAAHRKPQSKENAKLIHQTALDMGINFIDTADDYYNGLDVHYSSGVFNRMFYLMATAEGWNTHMAFDVMVKANSDYWGPYEKFQSGACGVLKATRDFGYPMSDVENAISRIDFPDDTKKPKIKN